MPPAVFVLHPMWQIRTVPDSGRVPVLWPLPVDASKGSLAPLEQFGVESEPEDSIGGNRDLIKQSLHFFT